MSGVSDVSHSVPVEAAPVEVVVRRQEPVVAPAEPVAAEPTAAELHEAANSLNRILDPLDFQLSIRYDEEISRFRVKIVDRRTNEIIREIPNRSVLDATRQAARGLFVDQLS